MNRLANETSPYLLQHKDNPVDWYPWGEEALERARREDKPLLVSIGYSACHWCHVMERESFEDAEVAAVMNERFVCIKVDREERPDVDAIYMEAVQLMTGHGGWPLNAFLTPDGVPFYAGTYWPPTQTQQMPSWRMVLEGVARGWDEQRDDIVDSSQRIVDRLQATARIEAPDADLEQATLEAAMAATKRRYDGENGGWGGAPKFPAASMIEFLLRRGERQMALHTLRRMAGGGIYDQVGGGFARYSVDARWLVPHFEKMLYDNALLARAYLHAFQVSGEPFFERVCRETLDWALRELRQDEGGFASALDADSEGVEGKFYVWRLDEVRDALGPELAATAIEHFGMTEAGQLRGREHPGPRHRRPARARRDQAEAARGARAARPPRARRQAPDRVERADDLRAGRRRRRARGGALPRRRGRGRRVRPARSARRRRAPAAHVQPRHRAPERLPRGPRVPARGAAHALRGDVRPALVRRGAQRSPTGCSTASPTPSAAASS